MKKNIITPSIQASILLFSAAMPSAYASTILISNINVDNMFIEYLSSSATDLTGATIIQSQTIDTNGGLNLWSNTYSASSQISGSKEFLIVEAINVGGPGGFLGDFSLSGTGYRFANGAQSLFTGDAAWTQSLTNLAGPYTATYNEGANGVGPWGAITGVNANADWIYSPTNPNGGNNTVYFETAITATSAVPEPASLALIAAGFLGLGISRTRKRKAKSTV